MGRALSVIGVPTGAGEYSAALEGLTALNEYLLRANPSTPALHDAGVRYTKESTDKWRDLTAVLKTKAGDCEALSTWRAAELRVSGEDPNASVVVYKTGPAKYHAIVLRGDGSVEDPSVEMGMKPPAGLLAAYDDWNSTIAMAPKQEDQPMVMGEGDDVACAVVGANDAPSDLEVVYDVIGTDDGYKGVLRIPLSDGRAVFAETSTAATPKEAAGKAHRVLGVIGSVWDDLIVLAPSPQAQAAIRIARNDHVQNLAKAAYGAGKKAIGRGDKSSPSSSSSSRDPDGAAQRFAARHASDGVTLPTFDSVDDGAAFDHGQGFDLTEGTPIDVDSGPVFYEVNGATMAADELAILGAVNEALARGSKPRPIVGRAARGGSAAPSGGRAASSGGRAAPSGGRAAPSGGAPRGGAFSNLMAGNRPGGSSGSGGGAAVPRGSSGGPATQARGGASQNPFAPTSSPFSPSGPAFGPSSPYGGGPAFGTPGTPAYSGGPPAGFNPQSAAAAFLQQRQQNQAKSALLRQSDGSGGGGGGSGSGGGGGGGGSDYDGGYTQADAAASQQADDDLFAHYYGNQALQAQEEQFFNTAVETDADQFFGAVDTFTADSMLRDDSIPAE